MDKKLAVLEKFGAGGLGPNLFFNQIMDSKFRDEGFDQKITQISKRDKKIELM